MAVFMVFLDTVNAQGCTRALKIKTFNFFQLIFCFYLQKRHKNMLRGNKSRAGTNYDPLWEGMLLLMLFFVEGWLNNPKYKA